MEDSPFTKSIKSCQNKLEAILEDNKREGADTQQNQIQYLKVLLDMTAFRSDHDNLLMKTQEKAIYALEKANTLAEKIIENQKELLDHYKLQCEDYETKIKLLEAGVKV